MSGHALRVADHVATFATSPLARFADLLPWEMTARSRDLVARIMEHLPPGYEPQGGVAVHRSATIEHGAVLKGPAIIGPGCFIAAGAYVRDGCWLEEGCILGPGAELKSSFLFAGTKLAHFNFVGDSVLGARCNLEAGAIIANYRNERPDPAIVIHLGDTRVATGATKFGALLGDGVRVGANAVIAPGALLRAGEVVPRLSLLDQG